MFLKTYKPYTSGTRHRVSLSSSLLNSRKYKKLTVGFSKNSGRNCSGSITVRRKRGKNVNHISIDFKRRTLLQKFFVVNTVRDLNRSSLVSLIKFSNGAYSYILSAYGFTPGLVLRSLISAESVYIPYKLGYGVILKNLLPGSIFYNLELKPGAGAIYARSAGTYCVLVNNNELTRLSKLRLPSGLEISISSYCLVVLGRNSNV
jgi:large subunit ribosomal protein L2